MIFRSFGPVKDITIEKEGKGVIEFHTSEGADKAFNSSTPELKIKYYMK